MHQPKVEEKSSTTFRVLDKRFSQTNSFSTSTVAKKTDVASSVIDHLIKNIEKQTETKESPLPMGVRFAQDVGVKVVFPEHTSLARVSVEHLLQQVAGKALITLRDGQSEMRLQLTPPELGRMDMKIVLEDGQMKGKIVVSTPEAKALFDQNLGELQRQLQQVGIQLGQLDVSLGQFERGDSSQSNMDSSFSSLGNVEGVLSTEEVVSSSLWESNAVNYIV
jgi:flagellar hook-length control protein FliK